MKKYFLFLLLFAIGCTETREMERVVLHYGFDFTDYTKKGFLITPEGYLGQYESVGYLSTYVFPAIKKREEREKVDGVTYIYQYNDLVVEKINTYDAADEIYKKAKSMGADAIIHFSVKDVYVLNGPMLVHGIEVTGFAIKRKKFE